MKMISQILYYNRILIVSLVADELFTGIFCKKLKIDGAAIDLYLLNPRGWQKRTHTCAASASAVCAIERTRRAVVLSTMAMDGQQSVGEEERV